jgi:hypothetical protein
MKRTSLTTLAITAVVLVPVSVQAATLSLKWAADETSQTLGVDAGSSATVNVYVDLPNNNGAIATVFFAFASDPADSLWMSSSSIVPAAGWNAGGQSGILGDLAQFAVTDPTGTGVTSGSLMVGSFRVYNANAVGDDSQKNIFSNAYIDQGVLDPSGDPLTWDSRYSQSYDTYVWFGDWGGPYWEPPMAAQGQSANPLILINEVYDGIPEPASAGLLALAAVALLRRREGAP